MKTGNLIYIHGGKTDVVLDNKQYSILSAHKKQIKNERHYSDGRLLIVKNNSAKAILEAHYNDLEFGHYNYRKGNIKLIKQLIEERHGYPSYELEFTSDYKNIVKKQLLTLKMF